MLNSELLSAEYQLVRIFADLFTIELFGIMIPYLCTLMAYICIYLSTCDLTQINVFEVVCVSVGMCVHA